MPGVVVVLIAAFIGSVLMLVAWAKGHCGTVSRAIRTRVSP